MSYQGLDGAFSAKFYDQDTRKGFVKKVYGILGLQLQGITANSLSKMG